MGWKEASFKAKKESKRIELGDLYKENKKALREFLHYINDTDEISPYDKEGIETELALGCIVYPREVKWHIIKGLMIEFFDENNIIIEIGVDYTMEPKFCYKVSEYIEDEGDWEQTNPNWSDLYYKRIEAEIASFTKAFELFEQKL